MRRCIKNCNLSIYLSPIHSFIHNSKRTIWVNSRRIEEDEENKSDDKEGMRVVKKSVYKFFVFTFFALFMPMLLMWDNFLFIFFTYTKYNIYFFSSNNNNNNNLNFCEQKKYENCKKEIFQASTKKDVRFPLISPKIVFQFEFTYT